MNKIENLETTVKKLELIRDILLQTGIRNEADDAQLQKICGKIDAIYAELLESFSKREY